MFKKQSILVSLYILSGLTGLGYILLFSVSLLHLFGNSSLLGLEKSVHILANNFILIGAAMVLSLPLALVITFVIVSNIHKRLTRVLKDALEWVDQAPILLFGLFLLVFLGATPFTLVLTYSLIAVVKITKRWIRLSNTVTSLQLDAAFSLGMSLRQILFTIYIKRLCRYYAAHFTAVACLLFTLFTPFIVFYNSEFASSHLISLELFRRLGQDPSETASIVFLILIGHLLKVIADFMAVPKQVEHG